MLGSDIYLHVKLPGIEKSAVVRLNNTCRALPGEHIRLGVQTCKFHAFDKESLETLIKKK